MRFLSRPRVVPIRGVDEHGLISRLRADLGERWTTNHEENLRAVLGGLSLSEFQARSTETLLSSVGSPGGTCITAGTGAGKTLAFYLPALTHTLSVPGPVGIPRIVAIYPRVELLRDQLRALLELLSDLDVRNAQRLRVGVLYGATPEDRQDAEHKRYRGWHSTANGLKSPIVGCLEKGCPGDLIWPNSHTESASSSLHHLRVRVGVTRVHSSDADVAAARNPFHDDGNGEPATRDTPYATIARRGLI